MAEIYLEGMPSTSATPPQHREIRNMGSAAARSIGADDFKHIKLHSEFSRHVRKFNTDSRSLESSFIE